MIREERSREVRGPIRTWEDVRPGDLVFSEFFGCELKVASIRSDRRWTFEAIESMQGERHTRVRTKLSWYIARGLIRKKE